MSLPLVGFIIVNFNGRKYLKKCFDSILGLDYPKDKLEIIMVDNGSKDSSLDFVRKHYLQVKVLRNKENNYCSANNLGIKHAKSELVALVNNDVMLDKDWLKELVREIISNNKIGGVGGKILFFNGRIQSAGQIRLDDYKWTDIGFKEKDKGQYDKKKEVISLSGAAVLYRKKCLLDAGGFDEDFRMYCDEADIGIRFKKKGWKLVYVPTAVAHHKFMATAGKKTADYYSERNRLLLIAKYEPALLFQALPKSSFFELATLKDIKKEITLILGKTRTNHRNLYPIFAEFLIGVKALMLDRKQQMKKMRLIKNKVIHHRNKIIKEKDAIIRRKEKQIDSLQRRIDESARSLTEKERMLKQREKTLKEIYDSRGWKLLTKVHNTKKRLGMIK